MAATDKAAAGAFATTLPAIEQRIVRAYSAAVGAFEKENWDATIIACGKVLEEIAKSEVPYNERSGTLGQLLERLPKHFDAKEPLVELGAAIKDRKRLGALFDLERDTDEDLAQATIAVIESFITYIYAFRAKVRDLMNLLDAYEADEKKRTEGNSSSPETARARADVDEEKEEAKADASKTADDGQAKAAEAAKEGTRPTEVKSGPNRSKKGSDGAFDNFEVKSDPFDASSAGWKT